MLSVTYAVCHEKAVYAKCHYAECRYAECQGAPKQILLTQTGHLMTAIYGN